MRSELIHKIFHAVDSSKDSLILDVFRYQYENNPLFQDFCRILKKSPGMVKCLSDLPFLPIRFFKSHQVKTGNYVPETFFESSGTTGMMNSRHYIASMDLYRNSFEAGFRQFYGDPGKWCIIGLLPAYLERQHSSLVVMVDELIRLSGHARSGFYLYDFDRLNETLQILEDQGQKVLLFGVTFALLDFAEKFPIPLKSTIILETGGMKGRRKELTRAELHEKLGASFGYPPIHSEYGMTELLSQAYSGDDGLFGTPAWMKILLREEDDPLNVYSPAGWQPAGETRRVLTGAINVIDLANIDSCSFIATDDLARMHSDGRFEVLGRIDNADIRGCSLMTV